MPSDAWLSFSLETYATRDDRSSLSHSLPVRREVIVHWWRPRSRRSNKRRHRTRSITGCWSHGVGYQCADTRGGNGSSRWRSNLGGYDRLNRLKFTSSDTRAWFIVPVAFSEGTKRWIGDNRTTLIVCWFGLISNYARSSSTCVVYHFRRIFIDVWNMCLFLSSLLVIFESD